MNGRLFTIEEVIPMLAEGPPLIAEITAPLSPELLRTAPAQDEWSATDVLAHLRASGDVWGDAIDRILTEDHPTFRAVNPVTWIKQTNYRDLEFRPSFRSFEAQRAELLSLLESLPPEDWERAATVTGAGRPSERTIQKYATWLARHERSHYRQFRNIVEALQA